MQEKWLRVLKGKKRGVEAVDSAAIQANSKRLTGTAGKSPTEKKPPVKRKAPVRKKDVIERSPFGWSPSVSASKDSRKSSPLPLTGAIPV